MRAGKLDRVIEIHCRTTGLDLYGTVIDNWALVSAMRAQLLAFSTDDREGQRGSTTDTVITFRTRWLDCVSLENRVIYDGQAFNIVKVKEIGRRSGLDLICDRVGP